MQWLQVVTLINLILDLALKHGVPLAAKIWGTWASEIDGLPTDQQMADLRAITDPEQYFAEHEV